MAKSKPYQRTLKEPMEKIKGLTSQVIEQRVMVMDLTTNVIRNGKPVLHTA